MPPLIFPFPTNFASNISKYKHEIFWIRQHGYRGAFTAAHPSAQKPWAHVKRSHSSAASLEPLFLPASFRPFSLWLLMGGSMARWLKLKPEPTLQPQDLHCSCRACSKFTGAHIFLTSPAGAGTSKRLFINSSGTNEQERKQIHL